MALDTKPESDSFEEFWKYYPRKVGKAIARKKFEIITTYGMRTRTIDRDSGLFIELTHKASPEEIVEGAKRYTKNLLGPDYKWKIEEKFIPYPSTWLNRGGWED